MGIQNENKIKKLGYKILKKYRNKNSSWRIIVEDKFGYKYDSYLENFIRNKHLHIVGKDNLFSLYNISLWLKLNKKDFKLCRKNIYKGSENKLKLYHYKCGENFLMNWTHIYKNIGCPVCAGRQVGKYNNLKYLFPKIAKEWHPDNILKSNEVVANSNKKVMWICSVCGHGKDARWRASISSRINHGCPVCSGNIVGDNNRLSIICPTISKNWHPIKNKELSPYNISYGSTNKVWWLCKFGHDNFSSPNSVTNKNKKKYICPTCSIERRESYLAHELKKYFVKNYNAETEKSKGCKNLETGHFLFYDIFIPKSKAFIEVNGEQHYKISNWHKRQSERNGTSPQEEFEHQKKLDKIKKKYARQNGIYIEIDLRKIKEIKDAIEYAEGFL